MYSLCAYDYSMDTWYKKTLTILLEIKYIYQDLKEIRKRYKENEVKTCEKVAKNEHSYFEFKPNWEVEEVWSENGRGMEFDEKLVQVEKSTDATGSTIYRTDQENKVMTEQS